MPAGSRFVRIAEGTPFWSPDGKWILFNRTVNTGSDLMIVENF